jgi:hypothetical protein
MKFSFMKRLASALEGGKKLLFNQQIVIII